VFSASDICNDALRNLDRTPWNYLVIENNELEIMGKEAVVS
jgi:hypothetical protein